ncbi:MAG: LCP family protein [Bacillaceae bacterium]|nr:LCP family protein [Bacillaceae bacterium]
MAQNRKKRKKSLWILWSVFGLILFAFGVTAGYAVYLTDMAKDTTEQAQLKLKRGSISEKRTEPVDPDYDNISILFLGIDDSEVRNFGGNARSDAMVLATFNEKEKSVKMVSIPRDSYVYVPVEGRYDKITHAHAYGGVDAAVETVEQLFDIPVDYFVRLNFEAFIEVVDALGGIEYDVPFHISEKNSEDVHNAIVLEKGLQILNGEEALALARTRKYDSDLARGERQLELLKAIFKKAASIQSVGKYDDLIESIGGNMKTNLSFDEMVSFHDYVFNRKSFQIETMQLKGDHTFIDEIYYYRLDETNLNEVSKTLKNHLEYGESSLTKAQEDSSVASQDDVSQDRG